VPLEFIEEGVKDPLTVEEVLKGRLETSSSVFNPLEGGFRLLFRVNEDVHNGWILAETLERNGVWHISQWQVMVANSAKCAA